MKTQNKPWTLRLEEWLFFKLKARHIRRLSISQLESFVTWFALDRRLKELGEEQ
jgi:hypothetical protein